jgi:hypothetical protein
MNVVKSWFSKRSRLLGGFFFWLKKIIEKKFAKFKIGILPLQDHELL